jgi:hypothetical protein
MRYLALATDYDGTLATVGRTSTDSISALGRLRASGLQVSCESFRCPSLCLTEDRSPALVEGCRRSADRQSLHEAPAIYERCNPIVRNHLFPHTSSRSGLACNALFISDAQHHPPTLWMIVGMRWLYDDCLNFRTK